MADRTIRTVLELNASRFTAGAAQASSAARGVARDMATLGSASSKLKGDYDRVANTLLGIGAGMAAGMGLAIKSAMDWESAWAGVKKTVDGSDQQYAVLEQQLRGLAKTLPATHEEIAAVAEAAGQLGVKREDIASFTKTMIDLGETTNLTADEAATAIAQFSNVMGTSAEDTDNFGAALVALGNAGASTEKDILMMAQRLASTGAMIGASEQDVLGLSSALADVGISAEAGGGSISRVLQKMNTEVLEGGDKLEQFAEVAGVSAQEFAAKWRSDPVEAFNLFTQGLNGVTESGGNAVGTLKDLGIRSTEEVRAVTSLASAGDHLTESLKTSNDGWAQNTALVEEASKRYETSESKIKMARNALVDVGIDIGGSVLPILAEAAQGVASLAEGFQKLPSPLKDAIGIFGTLAAGMTLATGAALKIVPAVGDTVQAFRNLQQQAPALAGGLGKVGKGLGAVGLALGALAIADSIVLPFVSDGQTHELNEYAAALTRISGGDTVKGIEQLNAMFTDSDWFSGLDVSGLDQAYQLITDPTFAQSADNVVSKLLTFGKRGSSDMEFVNREWEKLDQTLAGMADSGNLTGMQETLQSIADETGVSVDELLQSMPKTAAAIDAAKASAEQSATAQGAMAGAMDDATASADAQSDALKDLSDNLSEVAQAQLGNRSAARDYQAALDDATDSVKENGKTLDITTEKGRANQSALDSIADSTFALKDSQVELGASGDELNKIMANGRDDFIKTAESMGMSRSKAADLADQLGLVKGAYDDMPDQVSTEVKANVENAEKRIDEVTAAVENSGGTVTINGDWTDARGALDALEKAIEDGDGTVVINGQTYEASKALDGLLKQINESDGVVSISADTDPAQEQFTGVVGSMDDAEASVKVDANTGPAKDRVYELQDTVDSTSGEVTVKANNDAALDSITQVLNEAQESGATVTVDGETVPAYEAMNTFLDAANASDGTITIKGDSGPATGELADTVQIVNNADGTITIKGNTKPGRGAVDSLVDKTNQSSGTVSIKGDNSKANAATDAAKSKADRTNGTIDVNANTSSANSDINNAARNRTSYINVVATGVSQVTSVIRNALGRADGGWIDTSPGRSAGGWVPGPYPGAGIDNVMWPVLPGAASGRMLNQPLAGTEYVVNGVSARQWGPALEAINAGLSPRQAAPSDAGRSMTYAPTITGPDAQQVSELSFGKFQHWTNTQSTGHHP